MEPGLTRPCHARATDSGRGQLTPFHINPLPPPRRRSTSRQRFLESQSQSQASVSGAEDDDPDAWRGTPAEATEMIVHHASILRNKRLLFAYMCDRGWGQDRPAALPGDAFLLHGTPAPCPRFPAMPPGIRQGRPSVSMPARRSPPPCNSPLPPFPHSKERIERLQELRWTQRSLPEHVENNLAVLEIKYFRGYDQLLNRYMRSGRLGVGLDLTAVRGRRIAVLGWGAPGTCSVVQTRLRGRAATCVCRPQHSTPQPPLPPPPAPTLLPSLHQDPEPPEDPFAQVRVLRDFGEVVFSSGKISLQRGKSHWLPRDEAHPLVMDGVLEFVPGARG